MKAEELRTRLRAVQEMCEKHERISAESRDPATAIAFSYIGELAEIIGEAVKEGVTA